MKSVFLPRLINGPFGDPGLHVGIRWRGTAVQFDLGRLDRFPAAEILKLTHVFISHTHIDHFCGFDRVLRLLLARDTTLDVFGPPGFIANVAGKLAGYTWNLVQGYSFELRVHEVGPETIRSVRMPASEAFAMHELGTRPFHPVLYDNQLFSVHTVMLDHKIPCLAFALAEKTHLNVRKDELDVLGVPPGPWLNQLKDAIRSGQSDEQPVTATWRTEGEEQRRQFSLGELRDRLIVVTRGQRIAYVVDALFSRSNAGKIVEFARDADLFFCESLFLNDDREEALKRYHLTARQAGTLARLAGAKHLEVFHFSPRYEGGADRLHAEAAAAFNGTLAADEPV